MARFRYTPSYTSEVGSEYVQGTGCWHIQQVLESMRASGMSLDDFKDTEAYDLLVKTVDSGSVLGAQAATSATDKSGE